MARRLLVLIVEDDDDQAAALEETCRRATDQHSILIEVVGDAESAIDFLTTQDFDLIVCDLAIPRAPYSPVPDINEGLRVISAARREQPGQPIIILSEYGDDSIVLRHMFKESSTADPYGRGTKSALIDCYAKEDLHECEGAIVDALQLSEGVASITITGSGASTLEPGEERAIQLLARGAQGNSARVSSLQPGLSGVRVLRLEFRADDGGDRGKVVAKLGSHARALGERAAWGLAAHQLPAGLGAPLAKSIDAGAGRFAAVSYRDLEEHDRNLFEVLASDSTVASAVVNDLQAKFRLIRDGAAPKDFTLRELRQTVVGGSDLALAGDLAGGVSALDDLRIPGHECLQHGDLHGENVLVSPQSGPMLIDYADFKHTSCVLDVVTLELSAMFHPGAIGARGPWPSAEQIAAYFDLAAFVDQCPFPEYVQACRAWQLGVGGEREIAAVVLAFSLRQLRYEDTDKERGRALVLAATERLQEAADDDGLNSIT